MHVKEVHIPLTDEVVADLHTGDHVSLSGKLYTVGDRAHKRLVQYIGQGKQLPFSLANQVVYYVVATPAPPGRIVGSSGPTTATRMDCYTPALLAQGLKGVVGKGYRSAEVAQAMREHRAVYFGAVCGVAAFLSQYIKNLRLAAFPGLGAEAVYEYTVVDFPVVVINDIHGGDLHLEGRKAYAVTQDD
ncbi:MAG: fumarate hydratase C-terminal domain-containing protein [Candidatus Desulforudis sp.]|nr:fumarate hydratase C-terminal domain-containing protein [Desulforudis sp.]